MTSTRKQAMTFVALIGVVSLFADMTYEAGRSVNGPFLAVLGAGSLIVGLVSGAGELLGYLLRPLSGARADRSGRYWPIIIVGYIVNLFAVPLLALAGSWWAAALLMVAERMGKGIRNPPRDVLLSSAGTVIGQGWVFGFHEAMDQLGATIGPLIVALVLALHGGYHHAYALLAIPALAALAVVLVSRFQFPHPERLAGVIGQSGAGDANAATAAAAVAETPATAGAAAPHGEPVRASFPRVYWIYLIGVMFIGAGFADFPLIAFHFHQVRGISDDLVPVLYAIAMAVDALAALAFGALLQKVGPGTIIVGAALSVPFAIFAFGFSSSGAVAAGFIAVALWGIGMGAHEAVMSAIVAMMIPFQSRGRAIGIFNAAYGAAWFLGSAVLGLLYGISIPALIAVSVILQALSIPFLAVVARKMKASR